jgi:tetratricopeptide (TPR) repeat protein
VALARITSLAGRPVGEALFVAVGRLFGRVDGSPAWLTDFLGSEPPAHILAAVAAGLGSAHPLTETIRPVLRRQLNALLADEHGVALGHALELAHLLQQAGMPRDSERLVRRALEILETYRPGGHDAYSDLTRSLLAGALAQQDRWPEILAFEPDRNAIVLSPHARFVENMRALALMESGKLGEAEEVLQRVLTVDATNGTALVGLTNLHLRAGDWTKAIAVAAEAKPLLSGDHLDDILVSEALAREQLGDAYSAATLLTALSGRGTTRADVMEMRERLGRGERNAAPAAPLALSAPAADQAVPIATTDAGVSPTLRALPTKPEDAVDVAIVTALEDEYVAMRNRLADGRDVPADDGQYGNLHGWFTGTIPRENGPGVYRCCVPRHCGVSRSQLRHLGNHGGFGGGAAVSAGGGAHRWQETARFTASRRSRAFARATTSSSGRFLAVPRNISSGVWPANAECGIFALCSSTKKATSAWR